jgi:hypothetical protein
MQLQFYGQLHNQLYNQPHGQIHSQLYNQLHSWSHSQVVMPPVNPRFQRSNTPVQLVGITVCPPVPLSGSSDAVDAADAADVALESCKRVRIESDDEIETPSDSTPPPASISTSIPPPTKIAKIAAASSPAQSQAMLRRQEVLRALREEEARLTAIINRTTASRRIIRDEILRYETQ